MERAKKKGCTDAPVPESKVVSLDERAQDEEKPFLEQLLQEGARKLLQAAIENEVNDYIQFHNDRRDDKPVGRCVMLIAAAKAGPSAYESVGSFSGGTLLDVSCLKVRRARSSTMLWISGSRWMSWFVVTADTGGLSPGSADRN
jgi:hypothetical protein